MKKLYLALFAGAIFPLHAISVLVTSENPIKISCAKEVFAHSFPSEEINVSSYPAASLVPDQPIGEKEGMDGAVNRMNNLPKELAGNADFLVSIENYIENEGSWYDRAVVLVKEGKSGNKAFSFSAKVEVPETFAKEALEKGETVGKIIQSKMTDRLVNAQDWHKEREFGGVSRKKLIKDALFKAVHQNKIQELKKSIAIHRDFPKKGIEFQDITTLLGNQKAFVSCIDLLAMRLQDEGVQAIVGLESRGFIIGAALAYKLGIAFVPVRKAGKIPGEVYEVSYEKEYGSDRFAIAKGALSKGQKVVVVDDLIATGGSARAAIDLVKLTGAIPHEFVTLLEVENLNGAKTLKVPTFNLID